MRLSSLSVVALSCSSVLGAPSRSLVHEKQIDQASVSPEELVYVRIALPQNNLEHGYDHIMAISDPISPTFGQHWTADQVQQEFRPSQVSVDAVLDFLDEAGFTDISRSSDSSWIGFSSNVDTLKSVFAVEVTQPAAGSPRRKQGLTLQRYTLPDHIVPHVDFIALSGHPRSRSVQHKKRSPVNQTAVSSSIVQERAANPITELTQCGMNITPPCIRALYDIPAPLPPYVGKGGLGLYELGNQFSQQDLDSYFAEFAPEIKNGTSPTIVDFNGVEAEVPANEDAAESMLDLTMAYGLLGPAQITFYETGGPLDTGLITVLDAVDGSFCSQSEKQEGFQCGGDSLPKVLSISYGEQELFSPFGTSQAVQARICNEFMKLSLQGHTIVVASGDTGVAGSGGMGNEPNNNGCIPQDYHDLGAYEDNNGTIFSPSFPATCPYVLSVGATMLYPGQSVLNAESTMELTGADLGSPDSRPGILVTSGGGFSNYFSQPSYQKAAVSSYLANHNPGYPSYVSNGQDIMSNTTNIGQGGGIYNRAGRGIPDVSANGVKFSSFTEGKPLLISGTSAAAPLWASLIAQINQERANIGKGPVGFVNPTLYQDPTLLLHDIKNGTNLGCGTHGFAAVPGWDAVSGLGTPNYPALLATFLALP